MRLGWPCLLLCIAVLSGCKTIPPDRYGVDRLRFRGMEKLDPEALRACLATQERDRATISFGSRADPECGVPPFDGKRVTIDLWKAPLKGWSKLDLSVFERDLQRIERWYQARGYYDARVVGAEFSPPVAGQLDRIEGDPAPCERVDEDEGCKVAITVDIQEGDPVRTRSILVTGDAALKPKTQRALRDAITLKPNKPFDEAVYEFSKNAMRKVLDDKGFACAEVAGDVLIDRQQKLADVTITVVPGPMSQIGTVSISGQRQLPSKTILATANLDTGDRYQGSELADAQRAIYALGAFASVNVRRKPVRDDAGMCTGVVDVDIVVEPGRKTRWGIGGGIQSGTVEGLTEDVDSRISDIHLFLLYEHRNFLGGLRRLRIEDRPKIVIRDPRFRVRKGVLPGNEFKLSLRWPAFIEDRTVLTFNGQHDIGPDPNDFFMRHVFGLSLRPSRSFFDGKLTVSGGINFEVFFVFSGSSRANVPESYRVLFFDQFIQLDLRDDSRNPRKGFYAQVGSQQSPIVFLRSLRYIRVTPEVRGYLPMPLNSTLAIRFGVGAMFIGAVSSRLDLTSRQLGPQNYRLRSGGPTSHRGFVAGFLGDQPDPSNPTLNVNSGGLRRWEASIEWRLPVTTNFSTAIFTDLGDVNRDTSQGIGGFRFDHLHTAVGFGFRYQIPGIGPARFDMGFLIPRGQIIGEPAPPVTSKIFGRAGGAFHFTIGEAF